MKITLTLLLLVVSACGQTQVTPLTCNTAQESNGLTVNCPGSPPAFVSNGQDGVDASPVTMVKFCSGYTTTYPSVFPEYGFCLSGKLYGTFFDGHNAWTGEIPSGNYPSTSTSAPCNFKVVENCGVESL
jgi:hypothetical protein